MTRSLARLTAASAIAVSIGVAGAAEATSATKVQLRHTSVGTILVNNRGFTLYAFTRDSRNHDSCVTISGCMSVWPALRTSGNTVAGKGVKASLLGSIKLSNGVRQVTYAGHPLYTYSGDSSPGSTGYVGFSAFGGTWKAVTAAGKLVK